MSQRLTTSSLFFVLLIVIVLFNNVIHYKQNLEALAIGSRKIDIDAPMYEVNWENGNEDDWINNKKSDGETIVDSPEEAIQVLPEKVNEKLLEENIDESPEDIKEPSEEDTKESVDEYIVESPKEKSKGSPEEDTKRPSKKDSNINNRKEKDFYLDEPKSEAHWSKGIIGSPESTIILIDDCQCELVSIDCLETIKCLMKIDQEEQLKRIYSGIVKRSTIKKMATYWQINFMGHSSWVPLGRSFQAISQALFREWMKRNQLPPQLSNIRSAAVNDTSFKFCKENNLQGRNCFVDKFSEVEQFGFIEKEALKRYNGTIDRKESEKELREFWRNRFSTTSKEYLLTFSNMARIGLNIRSHILDLYQERIKTISSTISEENSDNTFRVAMHIRRGDSCGHKLSGYAKRASPLDSKAQISNVRICYDTAVYMEALERIRSLAVGRQLVVYLATDHILDLMDDIRKNHASLFNQVTWKVVQHSRGIFNYSHTLRGGEGFIEFSENHGSLGETAILDIWHLSHGQVFIGHLGSRFGKLSWWEAMARHNSFVPFFTVDGHSACCDIDEACGKVAPSIVSMENCLTFSREQTTKYKMDKERYWTEGSFVRFQYAEDEIAFRKRRDYKYRPPNRYNSTY